LGVNWTGGTNATEYEFRINGNLVIPYEYSLKDKTAAFQNMTFTNNTAYTVNVKPTNGYGSGTALSASILTGLYLYNFQDTYTSLQSYGRPVQALPANGGTTISFYFSDTGDKSYSFTLYTSTGTVAATPNMTLSSYTGNTAPTNVTRYVVFSNLTEKTTYAMRTTITNSYGSNIYNSIGTTGTAQITSIPSLSVTNISDTNAVTLSWVGGASLVISPGERITYKIYFNSTNDNPIITLVYTNDNGDSNYVWPTTFTTDASSLQVATTYTVYMTADNFTDKVTSPTITFKTLSSITPIVRSSSSIGPYGFTVSWTGGATTAAYLDSYGPTTYSYSLDGGVTLVTPSTVNTSSSPYSIIFTGLIPLQTYNVTIIATNAVESYNSVPLAVKTLTNLTAPSSIQSSAIDATTFTLSWQGGTNATSYRYTVKIGTVQVTPTIVTNVGTKTAVFTNLAVHTTYTVIVTSVNAYDAINSVSTTVATLDQIITPITNLTTTSVEAHIIAIRWFGANYTVNSSYTFTAQVGGTTTSITPSSMSGGDKVAVFSSLVRNTQYTITVIATNTRNSVNASVVATTLENQVTPITSFAVTTSLTRAQYFTITWQGGLLATDYTYYLNAASVTPSTVDISASTKTATFSGLTIGTLYNVYIRAYNIDTSVNSSTISVTTSGPAISAITNVRRTVKPTSMVLLWDGGLGATEYSYSLKIGTTVATTTPSSENAMFGNTATFSDLLPSTTYSIVITATNGINTVSSASVNQATDVDKPYDITLTTNQNNQINLSWSGPTATATSYAYLLNNVVQTARITNGINNGISGKNVQIKGVPSSVAYSVIIRAIDSSGNNFNSSAYSLTTGSSSIQNITGLQTTFIKGSSITISWTSQLGNLNYYGDPSRPTIQSIILIYVGENLQIVFSAPGVYSSADFINSIQYSCNQLANDFNVTVNASGKLSITSATTVFRVYTPYYAQGGEYTNWAAPAFGFNEVTSSSLTADLNYASSVVNGINTLISPNVIRTKSIIQYYRYSINNGTTWLTSGVTDNGLTNKTAIISGLTALTDYKIVVEASNPSDTVYSDTLAVTTGQPDVTAITNVRATNNGRNQLNLAWDGGNYATSYEYYFNDKIVSQGGRLTTDNGVSGKNVQFNGIPTNTTYNIIIRARNIARGQSVDSATFTIRTGGGSSIQNVTNLQTTRIKGSSISISWTGQLGNPNIQYYRYSINNGATFLTSNFIDSGPTNNTAILNNLTALTSYRIVVGAWNADDAVQSDALVVSTTAPDISDITGVTLTGNGRNQINVAWSGGANATSYEYYLNGVRQTCRLTNGIDNGVSGRNVQLYGTPSNVQYSLVIRAISSTLNQTLDSSAFTFTTAQSSIQNVTNLHTTSVQSTSIAIAWTGQGAYYNSGGYAINYYRYSINDGVSFLTSGFTDNGTSNNTAVLTGLTSNRTYKIVVGAWNADDATYSDTLTVTTA